jgi:hypothetical protein
VTDANRKSRRNNFTYHGEAMNRIKVVKDANYTTINNTIIKDKRLSLKAKGLFLTVMALPDDWDFSVSGLITVLKEEKTAVYSALEELKEFNYCRFNDVRDKGRFIGVDYTFYEVPQGDLPHTEKPYPENPHTEKPHTENQPQLSKERNKVKIELSTEKEERERASAAAVKTPFSETEGDSEIEIYLTAVRKAFRVEAMPNEWKWGVGVMEAAREKITVEEYAAAAAELLAQPERKFDVTPNNVLTRAVQSRARKEVKIQKPTKPLYESRAAEMEARGFPKMGVALNA